MAGDGFWLPLSGGSSGGSALDLLHVRDEKASGTDGGAFNNGAWQTRTLNTTSTNTISGASLASNQITLPAGTFEIDASAPGFLVREHKVRLQNITDGTTVLVGTSEFTLNTDTVQTRSTVKGRFTLAGSKVLELQHRCNTTRAGNGFGAASSFGVVEVYAEVLIRQVS